MSNTEFVYEKSLNELVNNSSLEWIFVGGKGGVGKTTTSCSIATQLAKKRDSVLIVSTDPAHNVSDAFSQKFNNKPTKVRGFTNLFAMEIDSSTQVKSGFDISDYEEGSLGKLLPELFASFPGFDEALGFVELMTFIQSLSFSVIVFDTAPTGHTLKLLSFPSLVDKALGKFGNFGTEFESAFNMMSNLIGKEVAPTAQLEKFRASNYSIKSQFTDAAKTTFVCVCIPEFLSVYETERLILDLVSNNIDASYIVVNQILFPIEGYVAPLESSKLKSETDEGKELIEKYELLEKMNKLLYDNYISRRRMQSKYLKQISELYAQDFHVIAMPLKSSEVRGLKMLESFGSDLLVPRDLPILSEDEI